MSNPVVRVTSDRFRAEGALTIECQRTDYGPWICECAVSRFMELFEAGNGVRRDIGIGYKIVWSWDMYSIDEINRGYERAGTLGRLKPKLCSVTDTRFSEPEICTMLGCGPKTDSAIFENPRSKIFFGSRFFSKIDFHKMKRYHAQGVFMRPPASKTCFRMTSR